MREKIDCALACLRKFAAILEIVADAGKRIIDLYE